MSGANFGGDVPRIYDRHLGPVWFAKYAEDMAAQVAAGEPQRVLETACGTGIVTLALRRALPTATITATDLSPDMVKIAAEKLANRVSFREADGSALPFPDASFDAVVCQFGMMFYPDRHKGLREAHRVLAPGGRYLFSVWDSHRYNPLGRVLDAAIGGLFPSNPPRFYQIPFSYAQLDDIRAALQAAGFGAIDISVIPHRHNMIDFESFAHGTVFGSPVIGQIIERGGTPERVEEAVIAALRQEFGHEPTTVPLQAIIVGARKE
jgi:ubiquinone/menaquinone biosynthesis C-methylase UbiE